MNGEKGDPVLFFQPNMKPDIERYYKDDNPHTTIPLLNLTPNAPISFGEPTLKPLMFPNLAQMSSKLPRSTLLRLGQGQPPWERLMYLSLADRAGLLSWPRTACISIAADGEFTSKTSRLPWHLLQGPIQDFLLEGFGHNCLGETSKFHTVG